MQNVRNCNLTKLHWDKHIYPHVPCKSRFLVNLCKIIDFNHFMEYNIILEYSEHVLCENMNDPLFHIKFHKESRPSRNAKNRKLILIGLKLKL